MAPEKDMHFSSSLDIQSESLHEKIIDHSTGKAKVVDKETPHESSSSHTITTNPVKYEKKGTDETKVTQGKAVDLDPATVGYDTRQL